MVAGAMATLSFVLLLFAPLLVRAQEATRDESPEGWFTEAQADRGRDAYLAHCASCHSRDLQARSTYISLYGYPALTGTYFMDRWGGESVRTLYQVIRHTMPLDAPASLGQETYANIVAYILEVNSFPAGERELPSEDRDPGRLGGLVIEPEAMVERAEAQDPPEVELAAEDESAGAAPELEAPPAEPAGDAGPQGDGVPEAAAAGTEEGRWFTEAQAMRGDRAFVVHCARCHGRALQGVGVAPSLAGGNFLERWEGETVSDLFRVAATLMPLDGPGELEWETYAELVAYILWSNGFAPGDDELPPDFQRLEDFMIRSELAEVPDVP